MRQFLGVAFVAMFLLAAGCTGADEEGPSRATAATASQSPAGTVVQLGFVPANWGEDPAAALAAANADLRAVEDVRLTLVYPDGRSENVEIDRVEVANASERARFELNQTRFHEVEIAATFVLADGSRLRDEAVQRTHVLKPWHATLGTRCGEHSRDAFLDLYERKAGATGTKFSVAGGSLRPFAGDVAEIEAFEATAMDTEGRMHTTSEALMWGSSNALRFNLPTADLEMVDVDFRLRLHDGQTLVDDDFDLRLDDPVPCSA